MKNQLHCVIVDDEPLSQSLIEKFIGRVPYLSLQATYDNAIVAMRGVVAHQPDIVFLDINMPEMTGIEFLNSFIGHRPNIIFITAHQEYAFEGFEHDAVDYLLKPVAFDRFMKAIYKVEKRLHFNVESSEEEKALPASASPPSVEHSHDFFMVKADKKLIRIAVSEIIYVEGMKDYVKIHLADRYIITHITMTRMMDLLPAARFIRINRSFIVQISAIKLIEGNMVETSNGHRLMIGINYRDTVREAIKGWTIG